MKKRATILSLGYWFSSTTQGMLIHPYKSVRSVVRYPQSHPLVFVPLVWLFLLWLVTVFVIVLARRLGVIFEFIYPRWLYEGLEFLWWWGVWFLIMWQFLVGYLFWRFMRVIGK